MQPVVEPPTRDSRERSTVLAQAARALHGERDRDRLIGWATTATRQLTGAAAAAVCMAAGAGHTWAVDGPPDLSGLFDPRTHPRLRRAWQGDELVFCPSLADDEGATSITQALPDLACLVAVPILRHDGTPSGILLVGDRRADTLDDRAVAAAEVMAAHLGVALENQARLQELDEARNVQREVVEQLQDAVRPLIPTVPDTELGVSYVPADPGAPTGGDLYDWLVLPDGRLHLVVVDVMGKGVGATKDALAVTHAVRLLVLDGCPLQDVVARADTIVTAQSPDLVATLVIGHYDPATGELTLAGGGCPPLLVSGGVARELSAPGVPIGWPGAGSAEVVRVTLTRSDSVVFYTDGLIEADKDILVGLDALARYGVETAAYPAAQQARVLVERALTGAARRDDSLAVVLRCRHAPVVTGIPLGPFEHHLSPSPATVPIARNLLREWLIRVPVEDEAVQDLMLIATELCANAVEHARWTEGGGVALRARSEGPDVVIEVEDDGGGLSWPHVDVEPPDPEAEQGRGLWLVHTLADEVVPEFTGTHTVVRARYRNISPAAPTAQAPARGPAPALPPR